ncbi:MAG: MMPL family transporter [Bacteroidales bacterium]|nr:MMPL family transporter [Bacteroidales bacterium]
MEKLAGAIIRLRWLIIIGITAITIYLGYQIQFLTINSDVISSLPDDDPSASLYKEAGDKFGGNYVGMIILETPNVFTAQTIQHVCDITDTLLLMDGIATVTSLTNVIDIRNSEWGIEIGELVDPYDLPKTDSALQKLYNRVMSKDMYKGNLVAEDAKSTIVMFKLDPEADKQLVAKQVKQKIQSIDLPMQVYFGGIPMMINDMESIIAADIKRLIPIFLILMIIILYISFRTMTGVIMPLLSAGIAVIWTLGVMSLLDIDLTLISNNLPIILLAIGSAYAIHVINRVNLETKTNPENALKRALTFIIIPVFLAGITTVIGFISFIFGSYLTMIRDFGLLTAMGTFCALLVSILFVPAVESFLPNKKGKETTDKPHSNFLQKTILYPLVHALMHKRRLISIIWIALLIVSISGVFFIEARVDMQLYFKKGNQAHKTEDILQKDFGGSLPVFVMIDGDMQNPKNLQLISEMQDYMEKHPEVSFTQSVSDLIKEMNDVMGEGSIVPNDRSKIEQLWFLLDGQDIMPQLVNDDLTEGVIQSKFKSTDSKLIEEYIAYIDTFIEKHSTEDCKLTLAGLPSVYVTMNRCLINSQYSSLSIAIVLVLIIVGFILRSARKGFFAIIPIISTILILFGLMGFTGIYLDVATVLVASIALGIGIDYSIHITTHFGKALKETSDVNKAIEICILSSGKAIIINVVSVAAGFLVLLFSELVPLQYFGLLTAVNMVGSGLGALTLLPAILIRSNKKYLKHNKN